MKNLRRLGLVVSLTLLVALSAFADETQPPPCDPGETHGPPCATAQLTPDDSTVPGQTSTPPSTSDTVSLADIAVDVVQGVLTLF
jgi:hypothetical protein